MEALREASHMTPNTAPDDPRGLFQDAYQLELSLQDCRSIFLDWALGHDIIVGPREIQPFYDFYAPRHPDHPMTQVLREGLSCDSGDAQVRRGGARGRREG
jgi:hypothetical protein